MLSEKDLHNYQVFNIRHVIENPRAGLFLDMGLGKTVIVATAVDMLINDYLEISNCLVVGPKRVAESVWGPEVEKWEHLKHLKVVNVNGSAKKRKAQLLKTADIYTIGVDNVAWLCSLYGGSMLPFDMVVIDESSRFKSNDSVRFKAFRKVAPAFKRLVLMTGTPAPNGYMDLWSQVYLLDKGARLYEFITRYREAYFFKDYSGWGYNLRPDAEQEIQNKIKDLCISMKSEDYLDLPEKIEIPVPLRMPDDIAEQYRDFEKEYVLQLFEGLEEKDITAVNAAALINKLTQFSAGAVYDENRNVHEIHTIKIEAVKELVENLGGQPLLIAWGFKHDRDRLLKALKKYDPVQLTSDQDIKDWNAGKIRVFLMHPASGGHGLNLQQGGNNMLWYSHTFSLELFQQLNKRLHRQGQLKPVYIHKLELLGTVDTRIMAAQDSKAETQEGLMDAVKAIVKNVKLRD